MKLEAGEIVTLDNGKEYICFAGLENQGIDYIYLMSNFKPLEIRFAIQRIVNNEVELEIINDPTQKQRVWELFEKKSLIPHDV